MVTTVKPGSDKTTWFREEEQAVTGSNKTTWFRQEVYRSRRSQVQTRQSGSEKRSTGADDHKEQAVTGSANRSQSSGCSRIIYSSTGCPPIRCSCIIRSRTSGPQE